MDDVHLFLENSAGRVAGKNEESSHRALSGMEILVETAGYKECQ